MPSGAQLVTPSRAAAAGGAGLGGGISAAAPIVVDRQSVPFTSAENTQGAAAGQAVIQLAAPAVGYGYLVEVIDISSTSTTPSTANIYLGDPMPQNEIDFSNNGNHDLSDENQPRYVPSGIPLNIVWSGLSAKAVVTARIQYSVLLFVPVTYGGTSG